MIELPESFLQMPRWWTEGADWLKGLAQAVERQCARWNLEVAGPIAHGSNAIVVPVARGDEELALRMSPPGTEIADQVRALRWWDGRGMVLLYDADVEAGAMLLERLSTSLTTRPVDESMAVLGQVMRRLAVPAPDDVICTGHAVAERSARLEPQWERLGRPFDVGVLREALKIAPRLAEPTSNLTVNGDSTPTRSSRDRGRSG
jgi:streptomycin 6-kinase